MISSPSPTGPQIGSAQQGTKHEIYQFKETLKFPKEAPTTPALHTSQKGECLRASFPISPKGSPFPGTICLLHLDNRQATLQEVTIDMITLELSNGYQHSRV